MTKEVLNRLISTNTKLGNAQIRDLNLILEKYPYFQAARATQLKGLYQAHSFSYNAALKITAAYTTDRSILFNYITSEEFKQHAVSDQIRERHTPKTANPAKDWKENINMEKKEADRVLDPHLFKAPPSEEQSKPILPDESDKPEKEASKAGTRPPRSFNKTESRTFSEWLKLTSVQPISREKQARANPQQSSRKEKIIEKFIENKPKKIKPADSSKKSKSVQTREPDSHLMTETLAQIYAEQKDYDKAIKAYNILILKNPEKSGLFADRIREIKSLKENKTQ